MTKLSLKKSGQQLSNTTKVGSLNAALSNSVFDVYERDDKRYGLIYTFVQKDTEDPISYVYNLTLGNLTRGTSNKWARAEIRSTSRAFHKDNESRMAIPNDIALALELSTKNLVNYKPKLNTSLFGS